jgi:mono/diheme cytochrome c family protein
MNNSPLDCPRAFVKQLGILRRPNIVPGFLIVIVAAAVFVFPSAEAKNGASTSFRTAGAARTPGASAQSAPAPKAEAAGNVQNGKKIFTEQGCYTCHGPDAQGLAQSVGGTSAPRIGPTRLAFGPFLRFVRNPPAQMPPYSSQAVPDAALTDVYTFLQSLAPSPQLQASAPANAQNGQRLFTSYGCYQCHGFEGQGSTQTGASRIGPPQIPFPVFASYVRQPVGQMPPYASKAVPDPELADIYAYLRSRPEPAPAKSIPLLNQ